jgi:hypothetical protein
MVKFYLRILWTAITEFWGATDRALAAVAVVLFFVGIGNQKLVERIVTTWNGISPWWSLLPIGVFALYRVLRANYEAYVALERKVNTQTARETVHEWIGQRLQEVKGLADLSPLTETDISKFHQDFEFWALKTEEGLRVLGLTKEAHLFATADSGFARLPQDGYHDGDGKWWIDVRETCNARLLRYQSTLREILKNYSGSS